MNANSYDTGARAAAATPPGEHIPGPPSGGLIFLWIAWLIVAAMLVFEGGAIFVGILQGVSAG
jgi:hypothetical protein